MRFILCFIRNFKLYTGGHTHRYFYQLKIFILNTVAALKFKSKTIQYYHLSSYRLMNITTLCTFKFATVRQIFKFLTSILHFSCSELQFVSIINAMNYEVWIHHSNIVTGSKTLQIDTPQLKSTRNLVTALAPGWAIQRLGPKNWPVRLSQWLL